MKYFFVERQKVSNRSVKYWTDLLMLFFITVVSNTTLNAQILTDFPCYSVSEDDVSNVLFAYDPDTNEWGEVGAATTINIEAIATDPVTDIIYAIDAGQFGTLNANTGAFTPIGSGIGIARGPGGVDFELDDVDGLTYDAVNMIMYASHRVNGTGSGTNDLLFQIDVATGTFVPGAMQDPANLNAAVDFVYVPEVFDGSFGGEVYDVDDIAYNPYSGQLVAIQNQDGPGVITELNVLTGEIISVIYDLPDDDVEGLGFTYLGELYATTGDNGATQQNSNTFIFIDLQEGTTETLIFIDEDGPNVDFESFDCFTAFNDLALDKVLDPATPTVYPGDDVTFLITVYNQGGFANSDITLSEYIPDGLILNDPNWTSRANNLANITLPGPLESGASITVPITFTVDPAYTGDGDPATEDILINAAEITQSFNVDIVDLMGNPLPLPDFDSQPDDQNNEINIVDNEINQGGPFANADEDDHDIAPVTIQQLGTISGNVGEDTDNDDEPNNPIPGTTIELYDANGNLVDSTVTDGNGDYEFTDLTAGEYTVVEIQPPGLTDVTEGDQTPEDGEPTVDTPLDNSIAVTLSPGEDDEDNDFVEEQLGTISGNVGEDTDNDDEPNNPIPGTTIELYDANGNLVDSVETDENGDFEFTDLPAGEYTVVEIQPSGLIDVTEGDQTPEDGEPTVDTPIDNVITVILTPGENDEDNDFVEEAPCPTCDEVFPTACDDGDPCTENDLESLIICPDGTEVSCILCAGTPIDCNCESISGEVFIDTNNNGCKDGNETAGAAGIEVTLWECDPATGEPSTPVSTITTGTDGSYTFGGGTPPNECTLDPETTYTIQFTIPENPQYEDFSFSSNDANDTCASENNDDVNPDTGIAENCFDPANDDPTDGDDDEHVNAGITPPCESISGEVFIDANNNGCQDGNETGAADIEVTLWECDPVTGEPSNAVATITTGDDGTYTFEGTAGSGACLLDPSSTYTIQFNIPETQQYEDYGFSDATANATCDPEATDDVDPETGIANTCYDPSNNDPTDGDDDEHVNAGITPPCESISGEVFIDANNNGCQDGNETGAADIEVTLWECDPVTGEPSNAVATITTGDDGTYTFDGTAGSGACLLNPSSTYTIQFNIPETQQYEDYGFSEATADPTCDPVETDDVDPATGIAESCFDPANDDPTDGDDDEHVNAGITPPCESISGEVFIDANNNGCQDGNETSAADIEVTLWECDPATGEPSTAVATITTGDDGTYTFDGTAGSGACLLDPSSTYTIQFNIPETDFAFSSNDATGVCPSENIDDVDPATGIAENCYDPSNDDPTDGDDDEHVNVGIVPLGTISGNVGEDTDNDDAPNNPIPGTTIELYDENGNLVDSIVTDENGDFEFTGLLPGEYTVVEIQPLGFVDVTEGDQTPEDGEPTLDTPIDNEITVILTAGENDEDNNFVEEVKCQPFNLHTSDDPTICAGQSVEICASEADHYSWSNGSYSQCITVSPTHTKTFTVTGTKNGCEGSGKVTININDSFNLHTSDDQTICVGQSVEICAGGADEYWWSNGKEGACITVSPHHTKTYTVKGIKNGCEASGEVTVNVNDSFNLHTSDDQHICPGKSVEICADGADGYWWSNGKDIPCITVNPDHTKTYTVKGLKDGCEATSEVTVYVNNSFDVHISSQIMQGEYVKLCASGADTYWWRNGEDGACITVSPHETTTYNVIGFKNGCEVYAQTTVEVHSNNTSCSIDDIHLEQHSIGSNTATVKWTSYNNAWYTLYIRPMGSDQWQEYGVDYAQVDLSHLEPCTTYQWAISVKCSNGAVSEICDYSSFTTKGYCGYNRVSNSVDIGVNQSIDAAFSGIDVYPNPATNLLSVDYKDLPVQQIAIYNSLGKLIEYAELNATGKATVKANNYANGVYIIMAQANDKLYKNVFMVD